MSPDAAPEVTSLPFGWQEVGRVGNVNVACSLLSIIKKTSPCLVLRRTMSSEEVAKAFINHYYTTLDQNVPALAGLYVRAYLFHHQTHRPPTCIQ